MDELMMASESSLIRLLTRWYGEADRGAAEVCAHELVPLALTQWHSLVSRWSRPLVTFNRPVALSAIEVVDGMARFWDENQGCWEWAYPVGGVDPLVFEREGPDGPWLPTDVRLSRFLSHMMVFEMVVNAPESWTAHDLNAAQLRDVVKGLVRLPFYSLRWLGPGTAAYGDDYILALVTPTVNRHPDGAFGCDVTISSHVRGRLATSGLPTDVDWYQSGREAKGDRLVEAPPW